MPAAVWPVGGAICIPYFAVLSGYSLGRGSPWQHVGMCAERSMGQNSVNTVCNAFQVCSRCGSTLSFSRCPHQVRPLGALPVNQGVCFHTSSALSAFPSQYVHFRDFYAIMDIMTLQRLQVSICECGQLPIWYLYTLISICSDHMINWLSLISTFVCVGTIQLWLKSQSVNAPSEHLLCIPYYFSSLLLSLSPCCVSVKCDDYYVSIFLHLPFLRGNASSRSLIV